MIIFSIIILMFVGYVAGNEKMTKLFFGSKDN